MHPKTEIRPDRAAIKRVLDHGWAGQLKIHGHRAQIHLSPDPAQPSQVYNRQGALHAKPLPPALAAELQRIFGPRPDAPGWTVLDAEWLKGDDRVFVFDLLRREGRLLEPLTYAERWELLPRVYASEMVETLPLLRSVDRCLEALARPEPWIEGLVFRALSTPGFSDTSIVRCRRSRP